MARAHASNEDAVVGQDLRERYHRLVDLAPDAILIHDGERIVMANAAAVELAGARDRGELVGLSVDTFLHPPYLKGLDSQLAHPDQEFRIPTVRDTFRRLDGSSIEVEVTAIPFLDHGRPAAHLVIRDITERLATLELVRQTDDRMHQAQKMEAVGVLAGGVAHEVNNMMLVVLGFSDLLLTNDRLPGDLAEDVHQIRNAGERAAKITGQLLSFSRRNIHRPASILLDTIVHDLEPTLRHLLGDKCRLELFLDARRPILVDRAQLEQVLVNLTLNACDAMAPGGALTLTTSEVTVGPDVLAYSGTVIPDGCYGLITVADTGTGMNPAILARIFEPFYTTKAIGEGAGLGLAAVYGIVEQNGGYVRVESAQEEGTEFMLYLPLTNETAALERRWDPPRVVPASALSGLSVLVVDDELAVLTILGRILERAGCQVVEASDGAVALEIISRQGPPDLVLTDIMMPGIGGVELARRLKKDWPTLPVMFMSGFSAEDLHRQAALDLAVSVIQKPFTVDLLIASIAAALPRAGGKLLVPR